MSGALNLGQHLTKRQVQDQKFTKRADIAARKKVGDYMAWIEVHQTLPSHRKIKKLKRALKITTPQAVGHAVMLWLWSIDNAPDGNLSGVDPVDIAEACEWLNDAKELVEALQEAELIDPDMRIHNWDEYAGRLISQREERREKERKRKAEYRARIQAEKQKKIACPEYVPRDKTVCPADVPSLQYSTVPNTTGPNPTGPDREGASPPKAKMADYVFLTEQEYQKLIRDFGKKAADLMIRELDLYKGAKGKEYKDDYRAILKWVVDLVKEKYPGVIVRPQAPGGNPFKKYEEEED